MIGKIDEQHIVELSRRITDAVAPRQVILSDSENSGPLVPILTAFEEDDRLDIDSTCKWVDWLITKGIKLF